MAVCRAREREGLEGENEPGMKADGEPEGACASAAPSEDQAKNSQGGEFRDEKLSIHEMTQGVAEDFEAGVPCAWITDFHAGRRFEEMDEGEEKRASDPCGQSRAGTKP